MQLGGIEREHTRSSHQVTNCMHEHTSYQKTGAAHAAASGMTEKLEQNRQEQLEMQASPLNWLEKLFQKGRQLGRQIWGSSDAAGKAENAALTEGSREVAQTGVVASAVTNGRVTAEQQSSMSNYFHTLEPAAVPATPFQKIRSKIREAASQLADHLPGRFFGSQGKNFLQTKQEQTKEDLSRRSRYKKEDKEIECILTDDSYLLDSYDRKGEYRQLTTKK